jgi:Mrp family chromosome partitioning ATPase
LELSGYLATARRWWWTLLVATWIAGLAGYLVATRIPPTYEARALMLVGPYEGDLNTLRASGQIALTYADLVTTTPRLEAAIAQVGTNLTAAELKPATRVTANDTTRTLTIRAQHGNPTTAAELANALAGQLTALVELGTGRPEGQLQVQEFASPPTTPVAPQVSLIAILTALAGFLGALVVVVLIEYIGATVRSRDDVTRLVPVPFLGQIEGQRSSKPGRGLVVERLPASRLASSYRIVATRVVFADSEEPVQSLLMVGAQSGDGTGETAVNVAAALATSGRRTVLIDGDDVDGVATSLLGLEDRPGLAEVIRGQADLSSVVLAHGPDLHVVPVGRSSLASLDDGAVRRIMQRLLADHDLVIIAGPPTLGSAEALVYARASDASVVVVRRDQTKRDALAHAVESLTLVGANVLGVVLDARSGGRFRRPEAGPSAPPVFQPATELAGAGQAIAQTPRPRPASRTIAAMASPRTAVVSSRPEREPKREWDGGWVRDPERDPDNGPVRHREPERESRREWELVPGRPGNESSREWERVPGREPEPETSGSWRREPERDTTRPWQREQEPESTRSWQREPEPEPERETPADPALERVDRHVAPQPEPERETSGGWAREPDRAPDTLPGYAPKDVVQEPTPEPTAAPDPAPEPRPKPPRRTRRRTRPTTD